MLPIAVNIRKRKKLSLKRFPKSINRQEKTNSDIRTDGNASKTVPSVIFLRYLIVTSLCKADES